MLNLLDRSRQLAGHELSHDGECWMLLEEIRNDYFLAVKVNDPHPRQVYFIHVTWDEGEKERALEQ